MVIWKCNIDGSLDTSFNDNGIATYHYDDNTNISNTTIFVDSTWKIYVTGYITDYFSSYLIDMIIWKYK